MLANPFKLKLPPGPPKNWARRLGTGFPIFSLRAALCSARLSKQILSFRFGGVWLTLLAQVYLARTGLQATTADFFVRLVVVKFR